MPRRAVPCPSGVSCRRLESLTEPNLGILVLSLIVLLFSLTVHEAAHALTADRLGDPTARLLGRISLNPMVHIDPIGTVLLPLVAMLTGAPLIGWAKPVPVNLARLGHGRRDFMAVAAAGPASNLILAAGAALALKLSSPLRAGAGFTDPVAYLLETTIELNALLAVFNLLPVPPLDGGNVLAGILPSSIALRYDALRPYGIFVLYGLMFTGVLWSIIGPPFSFLLRLLSL